jgi:hypothetical protein
MPRWALAGPAELVAKCYWARMAEASWASVVWRLRKKIGLSCEVGRNEEVNRKMFCEFLAAEMDEFKWKFEFE